MASGSTLTDMQGNRGPACGGVVARCSGCFSFPRESRGVPFVASSRKRDTGTSRQCIIK